VGIWTLTAQPRGNVMIAGVGFDPTLIIVAALAEHPFAHDWDPENLANEIHDLLGPGLPTEVAMNGDTETFINKSQQLVE